MLKGERYNGSKSDALYRVKECSKNIIDSYTQPFYGLVEFARREPERVQKMFMNLYSDDGGNLKVQMELIRNFFEQCNELLEKYFPDSYLYKQNCHSVSSYLFLYDPDHHYMYKATQSQVMADCIEFYDDWGTGELHADKELHILLFNIIYCFHVYNLFDGITFERPKSKEKQLIVEKKNKAKTLKAAYEEAEKKIQLLEEALQYFISAIENAGIVKHKMYGLCDVLSVDSKYIRLKSQKTGEEKQLGLAVVIANGIITLDTPDFSEKKVRYQEVMKKADSLPRNLDYADRALEPYAEYLD